MSKSNAERQEALRKRRKVEGLKEFRVWFNPDNSEKIKIIKEIDERKNER